VEQGIRPAGRCHAQYPKISCVLTPNRHKQPGTTAPVLPVSGREGTTYAAAKHNPVSTVGHGTLKKNAPTVSFGAPAPRKGKRRPSHGAGHPWSHRLCACMLSPWRGIITAAPMPEQEHGFRTSVKAVPLHPGLLPQTDFTSSSCIPGRRKKRLPRSSYPCPESTSGRRRLSHASFFQAPRSQRSEPHGSR